MMKNGTAYCVLLILFTRATYIFAQAIRFNGNRDVDESCVAKGGMPGECRRLFSCPSVVSTFRRTRPALCGFRGHIPIVCCPKPISRDQPKPTASYPPLTPPNINFECGRRGGRRRPPVRGDVVGGKEATPNSWPWMVAVGRVRHRGQITWFCDGVLITPNYVLSAAHCVTQSAVDLVRVGGHNLTSKESSGIDINVSIAVIHPQYEEPAAIHDLALLHLVTPAPINLMISPVCLPWRQKDAPPLGHGLVLAGWGATEYGGDLSDVLREVIVTVFPTSQCDEAYKTLIDYTTRFPSGIDSNFLCAGSRFGGKDACQGDSGGPVVYNVFGKYMLAGVVTAGYGCGQADFPGIYASLTSHLQWIKDVAFSQYK